MTTGGTGPPSEHETVWDGDRAGDGRAPSGQPVVAGGDDGARPGPITLPARLRGRSAVLGWIVSLLLVLLAVGVYVFTRPSTAPNWHAAPPTWGRLTLGGVALTAAQAAGDPRPTGASWMFIHRGDALAALTGASSGEAEADFLVSMAGHFRGATGADALAGSQPSGSHLIVLVRAFDGQVSGRLVTDATFAGLSQAGVINSLRLPRG